jgi:hypothetical protein
MARGRQPAPATTSPARRPRAAKVDTLRTAADDFLSRFAGLVDEIVSLREAFEVAQAENQQLRAELAEGIDLFRSARNLVDRAEGPARGRGRRAAAAPAGGRRRAALTPVRAPRSRRGGANGRVTPVEVTADVVRAVIGRLGTATASEIADQITRAGSPVSGRAVRHIAKVAGAVARPGEDGRMVYSLN